MKQFLISPPFGNYIQSQYCTSILGSFTLYPRPGLVSQVFKTFRKTKGGWINKIGLRNPGITSIEDFDPDNIYSIVGLEESDWIVITSYIPHDITIELNLSCPNVHEYNITPWSLNYVRRWRSGIIIAKLPPVEKVDELAAMCIDAGVDYLHCSNTLPTPKGGISGGQLFEVNLPIVKRLAKLYPGKIIAGGGIYYPWVVRAYQDVGASHFSLSTIMMTPWRVKGIINGSI